MKNKIFGVLAVIGTMLVIVSGGQDSIAKILVLGGVGLVMMVPAAVAAVAVGKENENGNQNQRRYR